MSASVAANHPATAEAGLAVLRDGGTAADAAVAAVLACCVGETIFTGLGGAGFATYFDAAAGSVTCLDFFSSVPGTDGDRPADPMVAIDVLFGEVPQSFAVGGASVAVPGVPAGCGEVHRRWGRMPWPDVVEPARALARTGVTVPPEHARTLDACAPALTLGEGSAAYAPGGRLLRGGETLHHPGLDAALGLLAEEGPSVFYTGSYAPLLVDTVRAAGGSLGPRDLAGYRVLETPVHTARIGAHHVLARRDLNRTVDSIAALPPDLSWPGRSVGVASVLRDGGPQLHGDTTNISVVDADGNACVITTTLGIGSGVWLPGLGIHLNSMLGEGELLTSAMHAGSRMASNMCPLVVLGPDGRLTVAAGAAGASRIRTALVHTLLGVLVDGLDTASAIARPRFHVVDDVVHAEPGCADDELARLAGAGWRIRRWPGTDHYFGGVTAVGQAGAAGDPRRAGVGLSL